MNNVRDLQIESQILPIFDFTLNDFAKQSLTRLFSELPDSLDEIIVRQKIIQGFIANKEVLRTYSYAQADLLEVKDFLSFESGSPETDNAKFGLSRFFSNQHHQRKKSGYVHSVLFFNRLYLQYFSKIEVDLFPENFRRLMKGLIEFLGSLQTIRFEGMIKADQFKRKGVLELNRIVIEKKSTGQLDRFWQDFFLFEAFLSISLGILKADYSFPVFSDNKFSLAEFYHPLLGNPIKNSIELEKNVILLTGPNMSGKSTVLKSIGLCVYLAHLGFAVPASSCQIPFFNHISIAIDLKDDISQGYSHFMMELRNLKSTIQKASDSGKCFAVFDELFRGTNPDEAFQMTNYTLKGLRKFPGSYFIISTHFSELQGAFESDANISPYYVECTLEEDVPVFRYGLKEGWSTLRIGKLLFKREGLNRLLGD